MLAQLLFLCTIVVVTGAVAIAVAVAVPIVLAVTAALPVAISVIIFLGKVAGRIRFPVFVTVAFEGSGERDNSIKLRRCLVIGVRI